MITNKARFHKVIRDNIFDIWEYSQCKDRKRIIKLACELRDIWGAIDWSEGYIFKYNKKTPLGNQVYIHLNDPRKWYVVKIDKKKIEHIEDLEEG